MVHMPLYLRDLFRVAHPLHSNQADEGSVTWGMFPQGSEDTVARRRLLCLWGRGYTISLLLCVAASLFGGARVFSPWLLRHTDGNVYHKNSKILDSIPAYLETSIDAGTHKCHRSASHGELVLCGRTFLGCCHSASLRITSKSVYSPGTPKTLNPNRACMPHTPPQPPQSQSCDDSVTRSMVANDLFTTVLTSFLHTAFSVHGTPLFLHHMCVHCHPCLCMLCSLNCVLHSAVFFQPTVFVPHAHWEAYGRGSLPLHNLVSDSAHPQYVSDPRPQSFVGTGQL